jgi:hypothetical protein
LAGLSTCAGCACRAGAALVSLGKFGICGCCCPWWTAWRLFAAQLAIGKRGANFRTRLIVPMLPILRQNRPDFALD